MILLQLFRTFFLIGALSFGGGYGTLTLIEDSVVAARGWLTHEQLADLITMAEITPGPIALNAASFTGFLTAGIPGAAAATVGCVLPSCILVSLLAYLLSRFRDHPLTGAVLSSIRSAVCALIFSAFFTIGLTALCGVSSVWELPQSRVNVVGALIFIGALTMMRVPKMQPVLVILLSGLCGWILL